MDRLIPNSPMLGLILVGSFCLFTGGCSRPDGTAFDGLLSSNRIDRIEIVDDEKDHTNTLTADAATRILTRLAATNRIANPVRGKSYVSGRITFMAQAKRVGDLVYFPSEQVLSYQKYEFSLKDTNDLTPLFR
jgi:hypothetical protein